MAWSASGSTRERGARGQVDDFGGQSSSHQIRLGQHDDLLDEEVGHLSDAVGKLKFMAGRIQEETVETGKIQDIVAEQLSRAQDALKSGTSKMRRMHKEMTSSFGHMIVLLVYAVALIFTVVFIGRIRAFLRWIF